MPHQRSTHAVTEFFIAWPDPPSKSTLTPPSKQLLATNQRPYHSIGSESQTRLASGWSTRHTGESASRRTHTVVSSDGYY